MLVSRRLTLKKEGSGESHYIKKECRNVNHYDVTHTHCNRYCYRSTMAAPLTQSETQSVPAIPHCLLCGIAIPVSTDRRNVSGLKLKEAIRELLKVINNSDESLSSELITKETLAIA